ncbi:MAG: pyruvate/2-oxoglutarate/acetoin dehydrogenase E1 component, partial [Bacillariaceae sp.]
ELKEAKKEIMAQVKEAVKFADESPMPPVELAKELEFPDAPDTDYNLKVGPAFADEVNARTISPEQMKNVKDHMASLIAKAEAGEISIGDAINLAIHEEMLRDPSTTMHAEDLQAGSSYDIPKLTQQTYGSIRAADEIIDEGHFIGKALGEGLNGYRPIVELMNTNFGIYGMAELSSAGNTFATTGGKFDMPMTIIGAGGTAPNQSLGAEHSQPFHAYVMGIPGLKIATAASPAAAYGITKSMIRDNGPCFLFAPVKQMKESKGPIDLGKCMPLNKAAVLQKASEETVKSGNAVTVLTYLHGVKESYNSIEAIQEEGFDIDLIELRSLKPLDMDTIRESLERTNKLVILDESTKSGGVGATISALVSEELFDLLDAPVKRLCMDDAPVPYASSMEVAVVKRGSDLIEAVFDICTKKW